MNRLRNLVLLFCLIHCSLSSNGPFAWRCTDGQECWREKKVPGTGQMSLEKCKLICGPHAALVPLPKSVTLSKETVSFLQNQISHVNMQCSPKVCTLLDRAVAILNDTLSMYHPDYEPGTSLWIGPHSTEVHNHHMNIQLSVSSDLEHLSLFTDESYMLRIDTVGGTTFVFIEAPTFFGARHALETLGQLIDYDGDNNALQVITEARIKDSPTFTYRGFIIDTSRNYVTVNQIKRIIKAMAYNKLNTFHWHITDTHSFPLILNSLPNMATYGAYSPKQVYHPADVREIIDYAHVRGIRVLPEFDAPAHVGHGWQWGEDVGLGKLVVCLDKIPWTSFCVEPPCGQMNFANPNLYKVLQQIYIEIADLFRPLDMFHYGGDEVNLNCWNTSSEITEWMHNNGLGLDEDSYYLQWSVFQETARRLLTKANKDVEVPAVIWTSHLTEKGRADQYLNKEKYIIQIWTTGEDKLIGELLEKGFRVIFSNYDALYFDCGVSSWVGKGTNWCSPYKGWQDVYDNDILGISSNLTRSTQYNDQVLGGEAALWLEQTDSATIDAKLWPRGSALAERLWTNPSTDYSKAEHRMLQHRHRLYQRGIQASRLQPEWCRQNQGQCRLPSLPKP